MTTPLIRRELQHLKAWHGSDNRKPLIIRGARQVGKSTLVRQFAEQGGLPLLEFNFERNPEYRDAFATNDPARILSTLQILTGNEFDARKVILFFDEIQAAPEAIVALLDAWPPAVYPLLDAPAQARTLSWTIHFTSDQSWEPGEWLYFRSHATVARDGLAHTTGTLQHADGTLLATMKQLIAVREPRRRNR